MKQYLLSIALLLPTVSLSAALATQAKRNRVEVRPLSQWRATVKLKEGEELKGRLLRLGPDFIELLYLNNRLRLTGAQVESIQIEPDSPLPRPSPSSLKTAPREPKQTEAPLQVLIEENLNGQRSTRAQVLSHVKARFTDEARANKVSGEVRLDVLIGVNGWLSDIKVIRGLPDGLTEKAIEAAQKLRFIPATRNGLPVTARATIIYNFTLY